MRLTAIAVVLCACLWLSAGDVAHLKSKAKLLGRLAGSKHHKRGVLSAIPPFKLGHDIPLVTHSVVKPLVVTYPPTAALTAVKVPLSHPLLHRYPVGVGHKVPVPHPHYGLKFPHLTKAAILPKPDHHFHHHHHHVEPRPLVPVIPSPVPAPVVPIPVPTATITHPIPAPAPPVVLPTAVVPQHAPLPVHPPNHFHFRPTVPTAPVIPAARAPVVAPAYPIAPQLPYILQPGGAVQSSVFATYPRYPFGGFPSPVFPLSSTAFTQIVPHAPQFLVPQGDAHDGVVVGQQGPVPVEPTPTLLNGHGEVPQPGLQLEPAHPGVHFHSAQPDIHLQPAFHLHHEQPDIHLQPGQPGVHLQAAQPDFQLQPGVHVHNQPDIHLQQAQPGFNLQPVQPEYNIQPGHTDVHLQPAQPEYHLQPGLTDVHLQPAQPDYHFQSGHTDVHLQPVQPDYHFQTGQADVHLQPGQPEYHLQPGHTDVHQQPQPDYHLQPGQTDIHLQSGQPDYHLQPQPDYLQPNQPGVQLQPTVDTNGWSPVPSQPNDVGQYSNDVHYPNDGHHHFTQQQGNQVYEQHSGDGQYNDYQTQLQHHIHQQIDQAQYDQHQQGQGGQDYNFQQPAPEYGPPQGAEGRSADGDGGDSPQQQLYHNHIPLGLQPPIDRPLDHFQ